MAKEQKEQLFARCIENKDCEDLEKRKIYQVLPDEEQEKEGYLRVIDESGEDYLYPQSYFILVQLPRKAQEALRLAIQKIHLVQHGVASTPRPQFVDRVFARRDAIIHSPRQHPNTLPGFYPSTPWQ